AQPLHRRALLLSERRVLQRLQRGQAAALLLRLAAHVAELGLRGTLLVLQLGDRLLARFDLGGHAVERRLLFVVLRLQRRQRFAESGHVQTAAFAGERLAAALGVERLAVEVVHAGALDVGGARGLGLFARMRVPALLPVREPRLRVAQRFLASAVVGLQFRQLRFGFGDRLAQRGQARLVAADVGADLGQRRLRLVARALQPLGHLALVGDLLLDPGQRAADLVDLRLRLVQRLARLLAAHPVLFDPALGLALPGDQLLQPGLVPGHRLAQRLQSRVQATELQRLPLGVLDPAL